MKEKDMFIPVKNLLMDRLHCTEVYGEIKNFDVLGMWNNANIIVEMKMTLNFKVIEQALSAKRYAQYVYIAVPKPKSSNNMHHFIEYELLKPNGIGLIYVKENSIDRKTFENYRARAEGKSDIKYFERYFGGMDAEYCPYVADISVMAEFNRLPSKLMRQDKKFWEDHINIRNEIRHYSDKNIGGTKSGENITDYSYTMGLIREYLAIHGWTSVRDLASDVPTHYVNPRQSIASTLRASWNKKEFVEKKESDGIYFNLRKNIDIVGEDGV